MVLKNFSDKGNFRFYIEDHDYCIMKENYSLLSFEEESNIIIK